MKTIKYIYYSICMMMMFTISASAYIDPSVMTYTIQVIAGVAVAVGAVAGIMIRRVRKKVKNKLGIDENAKKDVEDDIDFDEE
ncbi:MAG: hypothetical protein IJP34_04375 [Clostridia bacterium]|nr:hypothetical protein [Clostridia bacterium]